MHLHHCWIMHHPVYKGDLKSLLPYLSTCGSLSLTCDDVVVSVLGLVVLHVGEVGSEVLLRRHGLDGFVLLAEADVAVGVQGGDVTDEEVGRDGRLGEARAAARVAASQRGGCGGGALDVPVGNDGRSLKEIILC